MDLVRWSFGSSHNNITAMKALLIILSYAHALQNEVLLRKYLNYPSDFEQP